jgi:flagellar hook-associated protein 2
MSISFGGLGSGLDTNAIISALLQVEQIPIQKLQSEKSLNSSKLSLIGTLEGHVEKLQEAADKLSELKGFLAYSVTSSDESVATFTLTGDEAATGGHSLEVLSLASADRYTWETTAVTTDPDADLGGGNIHFTYGDTTYDVAIGSGTAESSLNAIAAAINDAAGDDVSASVINVGTDSSPDYQLVMTGRDTGADFAIGELDQSTVAALDGLSQIGTASNAVAVVDGLTVQRSDNVFDSVIDGLSFTATSTNQGFPATFSVEVDGEGVKENVKGFVDAYNAVMSFINAQSSYDSEEGAGGDLFGDSMLSTVRRTINDALFNVDIDTVIADTEGYSTLGLVGLDLKSDGTLEMDETKFDGKLSGNLDALVALFTDEESGLMVKLDEAIEEMVDTDTDDMGNKLLGVFKNRKETLKKLNSSIDKQITSLEMNLESIEQTLIQKFSALEELMAGLNAQSQFLSAQFGQ